MPDDLGYLEKIILSRVKVIKTGYCLNCTCDNCVQRRKDDEEQRKRMTVAAVISAAL